MSVTPINGVKCHLDKLQELVELEIEAIKKIISMQISQTPKDRETINIMLNSFLEQNSWAIDQLKGSLQLSTMIKDGREEKGARNQQGHPTKRILLRANQADKILAG